MLNRIRQITEQVNYDCTISVVMTRLFLLIIYAKIRDFRVWAHS